MNYKQAFGYIIAGIHAFAAVFLIIIPFLTSNITILIVIILIELITLLSWRLFNDKCIISIIESNLFDNTINSTVKSGDMTLFIHKLTYIFGEPIMKLVQVIRPYCMMCICALKIILASI
jgi:hypothetical protein